MKEVITMKKRNKKKAKGQGKKQSQDRYNLKCILWGADNCIQSH